MNNMNEEPTLVETQSVESSLVQQLGHSKRSDAHDQLIQQHIQEYQASQNEITQDDEGYESEGTLALNEALTQVFGQESQSEESDDEISSEQSAEVKQGLTIDNVNKYFINNGMLTTQISSIGAKNSDGHSVWYPVCVIGMSKDRLETFRRFYSHISSQYNNVLIETQDGYNLACVC